MAVQKASCHSGVYTGAVIVDDQFGRLDFDIPDVFISKRLCVLLLLVDCVALCGLEPVLARSRLAEQRHPGALIDVVGHVAEAVRHELGSELRRWDGLWLQLLQPSLQHVSGGADGCDTVLRMDATTMRWV